LRIKLARENFARPFKGFCLQKILIFEKIFFSGNKSGPELSDAQNNFIFTYTSYSMAQPNPQPDPSTWDTWDTKTDGGHWCCVCGDLCTGTNCACSRNADFDCKHRPHHDRDGEPIHRYTLVMIMAGRYKGTVAMTDGCCCKDAEPSFGTLKLTSLDGASDVITAQSCDVGCHTDYNFTGYLDRGGNWLWVDDTVAWGPECENEPRGTVRGIHSPLGHRAWIDVQTDDWCTWSDDWYARRGIVVSKPHHLRLCDGGMSALRPQRVVAGAAETTTTATATTGDDRPADCPN
jgi:hypothetical protein